MAKGYVSMRNEDGTQWASVEFGQIQWNESKRDATLISSEVFAIMKDREESTRSKDCPDHGFFGIYNLGFHEK